MSFHIVFPDVIFYPSALQLYRISKSMASTKIYNLVALMIWHSCYHVWTFKSQKCWGPKNATVSARQQISASSCIREYNA